LLLYDVADDETIAEWAERLKADTLAEKATELPTRRKSCSSWRRRSSSKRGGDEPMPIVRHIRAALEPDGDRRASGSKTSGSDRRGKTVTEKLG
jgi:hypothetical protein